MNTTHKFEKVTSTTFIFRVSIFQSAEKNKKKKPSTVFCMIEEGGERPLRITHTTLLFLLFLTTLSLKIIF